MFMVYRPPRALPFLVMVAISQAEDLSCAWAKVMGFLRETSKINLEGRLKTVQIELFGINFTSTWVKIRFMFP